MRLFTAIDLPPQTAATLDALLAQLRPSAKVRWSRAANLHITTKFIGEWPSERLGELVAALTKVVPGTGEIEIALRGLGWFPDPRHPHVLWVGVHAPPSLEALARSTDEAAAALGIPRETKPYLPHLTLARIDARKDSADTIASLRRAVAAIPEPDCDTFTAREWHLYLSEPAPTGSRYTKLETFPLS